MERSIATRTGDDGTTSLLYGQRVRKDDPRVEAIGAFDELNVAIGSAKAIAGDPSTRASLSGLQKALVRLMGELACDPSDWARYQASAFEKVTPEDLQWLDRGVAELETKGLDLSGWATPGATAFSAALDQARVSARRAERRLVGLGAAGGPNARLLLQVTNRLSDYLWLMARAAEQGQT